MAEAHTPLEWSADGPYLVGQVPEGRPGGEVIAYFKPSVVRLRDIVPNEGNASYTAKACNAYPRLVAALKKTRNAEGAGEFIAAFVLTDQLLSELGESDG